jgi:hypothetical protein
MASYEANWADVEETTQKDVVQGGDIHRWQQHSAGLRTDERQLLGARMDGGSRRSDATWTVSHFNIVDILYSDSITKIDSFRSSHTVLVLMT